MTRKLVVAAAGLLLAGCGAGAPAPDVSQVQASADAQVEALTSGVATSEAADWEGFDSAVGEVFGPMLPADAAGMRDLAETMCGSLDGGMSVREAMSVLMGSFGDEESSTLLAATVYYVCPSHVGELKSD